MSAVVQSVQSGADADDIDEDSESYQAFESRVLSLYDMLEDWTGAPDEEDGPPKTRQEDGTPVIEVGDALDTLTVFFARYCRDYSVPKADALARMGDIFDALDTLEARAAAVSADDGADDDAAADDAAADALGIDGSEADIEDTDGEDTDDEEGDGEDDEFKDDELDDDDDTEDESEHDEDDE